MIETLDRFDAALLLAIWAILPLATQALSSLPSPSCGKAVSKSLSRPIQPAFYLAAALTATLALVTPPGPISAALALPWTVLALALLAVSLQAAVSDLHESARRTPPNTSTKPSPAQRLDPPRILTLAAYAYLLVGAIWLPLWRAGIHLGFGSLIASLTAVHFHFAGFATCALAARAFAERPQLIRHQTPRIAALALLVAPPILAAGIGLRIHQIEILGAAVQSLGVLALAWIQLRAIAPRLQSAGARLLLRLSSLLPWISMPMAMAYSLRLPGFGIPRLLAWHGMINAFGFSLLALIAWRLESASNRLGSPASQTSAADSTAIHSSVSSSIQ